MGTRRLALHPDDRTSRKHGRVLALATSMLLFGGPLGAGDAFSRDAGKDDSAAVRISWDDGKTTLETERFVANLSHRMQLRWVLELPDADVVLPGAIQGGENKGSFRFARVRTKLDGWVYKKAIEYEIQLDWADSSSIVQDLNLNWDASGKRVVQVKFGQFKVPFGRQAITSAMSQQFVDRSIVAAEYQKGRDQGLQVWGEVAGSRLEYRAGVFNGAGRQRTLGTPAAGNDNTSYQYDGRVMVQPFGGDVRYSEGDFESTQRALLAVAVNVEENDARVAVASGSTPPPIPAFRRLVLGGDLSFKYRGLSLMGEYFDRKQTPLDGASFKSNGYHVQAGYFLMRDRLEVAFRYAAWDPSELIVENDRKEVGGALSYFYRKHTLKVQADFRHLEDEATSTNNKELRLQAQLVF
jgi:phosphate-selective porin OprO/OprP